MTNNKSTIIAAVIGAVAVIITAFITRTIVHVTVEQQLADAHSSGYAQAAASVDDGQLEEYRSRNLILEAENSDLYIEVSELRVENSGLQDQIDARDARGERPVPTSPEGVASIRTLGSMTSSGGSMRPATVTQDNRYGTYTSEVLYVSGNYFLTLLDSRYTQLSGTIFIAHGENRTREIRVDFELDGNVEYSHVMDRSTRPISIDIDLTDVDEFRIIVTGHSLGGSVRPYFAGFNFHP